MNPQFNADVLPDTLRGRDLAADRCISPRSAACATAHPRKATIAVGALHRLLVAIAAFQAYADYAMTALVSRPRLGELRGLAEDHVCTPLCAAEAGVQALGHLPPHRSPITCSPPASLVEHIDGAGTKIDPATLTPWRRTCAAPRRHVIALTPPTQVAN